MTTLDHKPAMECKGQNLDLEILRPLFSGIKSNQFKLRLTYCLHDLLNVPYNTLNTGNITSSDIIVIGLDDDVK